MNPLTRSTICNGSDYNLVEPSNKNILKYRIKENNKILSKEECRKILHNYYRTNKNMTEKEENSYLKYYNKKCPNGA